jgi:F0F1-type ATP synthase alpha subunit
VQAAILWAMQNGLFDSVPVDQVTATQNKFTDFLETRKESILNNIQSRGKIDEGIEKELGAAVEEFKSFNS